LLRTAAVFSAVLTCITESMQNNELFSW